MCPFRAHYLGSSQDCSSPLSKHYVHVHFFLPSHQRETAEAKNPHIISNGSFGDPVAMEEEQESGSSKTPSTDPIFLEADTGF